MKHYDIKIIQDLDESCKDEISQHGKLVKFYKGESPFCNDKLLHFFYFILSGRIKTYQLNLHNAKEQTIFILKAGDMFDAITLLDGKEHDVMYEVLEDAKVLQIPIDEVRNMIVNNANFNQKFFPYLASQMRQVEELATDISLYSTLERLAKLLVENLDPNNSQKYNLLHGLSHSEIAKLIGTVRHVVERHLNQLRKEDIMEVDRKHFYIKDMKKLLAKL